VTSNTWTLCLLISSLSPALLIISLKAVVVIGFFVLTASALLLLIAMAGRGLRVLVPVKRVLDYAVKPRVLSDRSGVDLSNVKMSMNPFCEIAVEEALKMKDQQIAAETIAVSIGPKAASETLRTALAMGIDRAIHIETEPNTRIDTQLPHIITAKLLASIALEEKVDLIITGKQSIDDDSGLVGGMLASTLSWSQANCASKVKINKDNPTTAEVTREVDGGSQTLSLRLPAVITTDLRLNTPRYATLPNIMKAKKKPMTTTAFNEMINKAGLKEEINKQRVQVLEVTEPGKRKAGIKVESVDELISKLRQEAKIM